MPSFESAGRSLINALSFACLVIGIPIFCLYRFGSLSGRISPPEQRRQLSIPPPQAPEAHNRLFRSPLADDEAPDRVKASASIGQFDAC